MVEVPAPEMKREPEDNRLVLEKVPELEEVAAEVMVSFPELWISPPEMVKPAAEDNPPVRATFNPPSKVEVAVDWTFKTAASMETLPAKTVLVATPKPEVGPVVAIPSWPAPVKVIRLDPEEFWSWRRFP